MNTPLTEEIDRLRARVAELEKAQDGVVPDLHGRTLNDLADELVQRAPQMVNDADGCLAILASQVIRWLASKVAAAPNAAAQVTDDSQRSELGEPPSMPASAADTRDARSKIAKLFKHTRGPYGAMHPYDEAYNNAVSDALKCFDAAIAQQGEQS